ncbi:head GIN domain-containing protein [Flavobacterium microcysteis]|uniref:DUF2807 domain-containing protein n=1 Tax=Flavobacterium microcysteis TaxID=2596891 RepID=A0A501QES4_9FLAO|nr:head GIN domain-containing protein [Flavobacterium microcysteis]TPD70627.1 DUF2807 domain-containing protein [Flavobacterium microcysteis]
MKKTQFLLLFGLFFIATANSQTKTESRTVGSFSKIESKGSPKIILVSGNTNALTVVGDEAALKNLVTEVKGNTLKIYFNSSKKMNFKGSATITVPFKQLDEVSVSGSGNIKSDAAIKSNNFVASVSGSGKIDLDKVDAQSASVKVDGSGKIELNLNTGTAKAEINGSGQIELDGKANVFSASIHGSGNIDASDFTSVATDVSISGSGYVKTNTTKDLSANIQGSGSVKYKGDPTIKKNISGSGKVTKD